MSTRSGAPGNGAVASNTLLLRRQLAELTKHPLEGFSAGMDIRFLAGCFPSLTDLRGGYPRRYFTLTLLCACD